MEALNEAEVSKEMPCMKQVSIFDAPALKVQEEGKVLEEKLLEITPKSPSFWKKKSFPHSWAEKTSEVE